MSKNGQASMGTWEYISASDSLLINRNYDLLLLNKVFIEKAVLFLRPDGTRDEPWILINKNLIPDLNYAKYLTSLLAKKNSYGTILDQSGETYYFSDELQNNFLDKGAKIYDSWLYPISSQQIKTPDRIICIDKGIASNFLYVAGYQTSNGKIIINQANPYQPTIGDSVYQNDVPSIDGTILFTDDDQIKSIDVSVGKIAAIHTKTNKALLFLSASIVIVILIFLLLVTSLFTFISYTTRASLFTTGTSFFSSTSTTLSPSLVKSSSVAGRSTLVLSTVTCSSRRLIVSSTDHLPAACREI